MELAQPLAPYHNKALPAGSLLREWRLERVLGVGGFGIVYRAKGVYFNETVAIKEYFPGAISDRQDGTTVSPTNSASQQVYQLGLDKFMEEAKVLWTLSNPERHPNIVSVRSLFESHGTAYMVMDFEEGVPLSELVRERRWDEASLLAVLRPIAEGLERAHAAGVLHRDIKPANILIRDTGEPVLIDFGSARFESGQATSTTVTFYTPPYAALEQYVRTYAQGPWTDIYALGVVLYQCVTGNKPSEVLERLHGGDSEPLSERDWPGFSRSFTRAVDAAMEIRPTERPQSVSEWLPLFERRERVGNEELTRIRATLASADITRIRTLARVAVRDDAGRKPIAAAPSVGATKPAKRSLGARWLLAGAGLVIVAAAAAAIGLMLLSPRQGPTHVVSATVSAIRPVVKAPTIVAAPPPSAQNGPAAIPPPLAGAAPVPPPQIGLAPILPPRLEPAFSGLAAEAARVNAPSGVLAGLSEARSKIAIDEGELRALASTPNARARAAPLLAALHGQVAMFARREAAALSSDAEGRAEEARRILGEDGAAKVAAAYAALRRGDAALAASSESPAAGPIALLEQARRTLDDYGAFGQAYAGASRAFVPARRQAFMAVQSQAETLARRVIGAAGGSKPWLFSSQSHKQAYQRQQTNAARAKVLQAQLAQLSQAVTASNSVQAIDADVAQASSISRELAGLSTGTDAATATTDAPDQTVRSVTQY